MDVRPRVLYRGAAYLNPTILVVINNQNYSLVGGDAIDMILDDVLNCG